MILLFTRLPALVSLPGRPPRRTPAGRHLRVAACLMGLASLGASGSLAAQTLANRGAHVLVQPGAFVVVRGSMANTAGSTLTNAGTLLLTGDFANAGALNSSGWVVFAGAVNQTLTSGGSNLAQVEVRNTGSAGTNRVLVPNDVTLTGQLLLTQGGVRTEPTAFLTLLPGATVAGEAPGRYVQGNLRVIRDLVAGVLDFGNGLALDATGSPLGTVTATRTAGLTTANVSYATNSNGGLSKGIDRIWALTSTLSPIQAIPLTFSWLADDDNGLTDFTAAQVWQQRPAGGSWFTTMQPTSAVTRTITATTTTLSRYTVSNRANPLPVELSLFSAARQGDAAWLRWTTASERNNAKFDVESSTDGQLFRRIATVASRSTNGQGAVYDTKDPNIARYRVATVYYRLRQVDRDSTETFSPVRSVAAAMATALQLQAYPNPFGEAVTVAVEALGAGPASVVLRDGLGRAVWQQTMVLVRGVSEHRLVPPASLPPGVYLLTVTQAAQQRHLTLTRQ
ncbi:T9SS type A sorting domain-containing protein [Hymenobacter frigidus]|uniref:T9SS type A sorting domain-containing protein n=1 Tax=Hymenobacter frigidus TaxID=1524095 RepID=UPI00166E3A3E|nr:T9SS type A sorting domain-containing protein [Hymenobacter frigidus]